MGKNVFVLDHIDNISIDDDFPIKNMHALRYLYIGIYDIAFSVRNEELKVFNSYPDLILSGSIENWERLLNSFNWFSINLINYVRLIGFIDIVNKEGFTQRDLTKERGDIKAHCKKYINKVIPDISIYRNKLSAHHALTDPYENDSIATLESSVLNSITYKKPYFETAGFSLIGKEETEACEIKPWFLTKVFEDLTNRYWPDAKLPEFPESKKMTMDELERFVTKNPERR